MGQMLQSSDDFGFYDEDELLPLVNFYLIQVMFLIDLSHENPEHIY